MVIVGSGSNIPVYLYQGWTSKFNAGNDRVQVRYMPRGTSESIRPVKVGIGDFGGGEILLTDEQMRDSKVGMMIPTILVGIVPIYNLPGNPELNSSGELLAEIYLGTVKNWKDPSDCAVQPHRRIARSTHFCRTPQSRQGIEFYLHRLPVENKPSVPRRGGQKSIAALAVGIGG
jgi:ABC-type phosphate transport system substrate-binding protein